MARALRVFLVAALVAFAPAAAMAGPALDLIQGLADEATPILNDAEMTGDARADKLQAVLQKVVNREQMAKSLMGRYWRRAKPDQRAELVTLLEAYLIDVYAGRVDALDGSVSFSVDGERPLNGRTMVDSQVLRPNSPSVAVTWQVEDIDGQPTVTDIVVEGVSLIVSQRADFASVIRQQGGIDGLIGLLRKKLGDA